MDTLERKVIAALFFIFGLEIIAWVPRFPEVKDNLGLSKGQFGTLLSASVIGSVIGLLTMGHLVHRYGARMILTLSSTTLFTSLIVLVQLTNPWQFLLCNVVFGGSISAFHISVNGQAFHEQEKTSDKLIPRFHGYWALGAVLTSVISGFLVGHVSLTTDIYVVAISCYLFKLILIHKIAPSLIKANKQRNSEYGMKTLFTSFSIDRLVTVGLICAVMVELATGDWATIFSKEDLHMSPGVSTIPYILFMSAMILGRLGVHRFLHRIKLDVIARKTSIAGGAISIASILLAVHVSKSSPTLGFSIYCIGTFAAGLGSSFLTPSFMDAARGRSKAPSSVVIGQLGVINTLLIFMFKTIIAWTAQLTSIAIALLIPSTLLILASLATKALKEVKN